MARKIKIIQIIPTLDIGGAERVLIDLVNGLDKSLFEVKVICLKRFGGWGVELKNNGVEMFLIGQTRKISLVGLWKLIKILKRERPDIVQTHLFGADIYGKIAAKLSGVKHIISTEHNLNIGEGAVKKLAKKFVFKYSRLIVAVSLAVKEYIIKYEGATADKVKVIYNGVQVEKFLNKQRLYVNKEKIIIGSMGRLDKQKGYANLIKAVSLLKKNHIECRIAGDGELRQALEQQIKKLDLSGKIKLIGWQKDSREFLDNLDIFVLPSAWEGFGLVMLEAGLNGLPVVASKIPGVKEIIDDKINGLLFQPDNIREMAESINNLIDNQAERQRLGENLKNKTIEKFDIKETVKAYKKLYLNLYHENFTD